MPMKNYWLSLITVFSMLNATAQQPVCTEWQLVTDSISTWNELRQQNKQDTIFVRKLLAEKYKTLALQQQQTSSISSFVFWQLPDSLLTSLHECWQAWCTANGYTLVQQPADANGFRRVSVYADKKKKQRIALYDRSSLDASRITVALSTKWTKAVK